MSPNPPAPTPRRVVIVGGGFSGACAAIQLVRKTTVPLSVVVVDPAQRPGRGLAYQTIDPDHRLNAPSYVHSLLPDDAWHLSRWCRAKGIVESDPEALRPDGCLFLRRSDFGSYIEQTLQEHAHVPRTGSTIEHCRDRAVDVSPPGEPVRVTTAGGRTLPADLLVIATGNPLPRLQHPFDPSLAANAAVVENALDTQRLYRISREARVLLVGSGLTALDVLSTLVRRGHSAEIIVVSRRGLRPRPQGPMPSVLAKAERLQWQDTLPGTIFLDRIAGPVPEFMRRTDLPVTARGWLRGLRAQIAQVEASGGVWYQPFDDLRDSVWQLWPTLPSLEKRRFLSKLRTWYDVHRFRAPPQNQEMVEAARAGGQIRFIAARLQAALAGGNNRQLHVTWRRPGDGAVHHETFDVVVNCTGLDALAGLSANPFLVSAMQRGLIRHDACSLGIEVDAHCRAVSADGTVVSNVRLVGPPTLGSFGDPLGAMFIGAQIHRMLPDALRSLGATAVVS